MRRRDSPTSADTVELELKNNDNNDMGILQVPLAIRHHRRMSGLCTTCGMNPPLPYARTCQECYDVMDGVFPSGQDSSHLRSFQQARKRAVTQGMCGSCFKEPRSGNTQSCKKCRRAQKRGRQRAVGKKEMIRFFVDGVLTPEFRKKNYGAEKKALVFHHYGPSCRCCGEGRDEFLTMDHIDRKTPEGEKKLRGVLLYGWLVKHGFPEGFRVLCFNCNFATRLGDPCPHELEIQPPS